MLGFIKVYITSHFLKRFVFKFRQFSLTIFLEHCYYDFLPHERWNSMENETLSLFLIGFSLVPGFN